MANDSSTGGYLIPTSGSTDDAALEDLIQAAVVGITGLQGAMVRPRFQEGSPKTPAQGVDWCAVAIVAQRPDANPHLQHVAAGVGKSTLTRHEDFDVFATFYGVNAARNATRLRDGFYINQNHEMINNANVSFVDAGEIKLASELVNQIWVRRNDLVLKFRRKITRDYEILNILAADVNLIDDTGHVNELIVVQQ